MARLPGNAGQYAPGSELVAYLSNRMWREWKREASLPLETSGLGNGKVGLVVGISNTAAHPRTSLFLFSASFATDDCQPRIEVDPIGDVLTPRERVSSLHACV
jgi:hypothetical protein